MRLILIVSYLEMKPPVFNKYLANKEIKGAIEPKKGTSAAKKM